MSTPKQSKSPPSNLMEVVRDIDFEEALEQNDPRFVDTTVARGSQDTLDTLASYFGLDLKSRQCLPTTKRHMLFFGHTGSGKTTELRHYAAKLRGPGRFFIVEVNVTKALDRNNLQYTDTLMAMVRVLLEELNKLEQSNGVKIRLEHYLAQLQDWFKQQVVSVERAKNLFAEISSGVNLEASIPFIGGLFAKLNAGFKNNATYKTEVRENIRNTFSQFADIFNQMISDANAQLQQHNIATSILFILDGTDKLREEDTDNFFIHDVEQLFYIETLVIYTAPIQLKYGVNIGNIWKFDLLLPMIKLSYKDGKRCEEGWRAMRAILLKRAAQTLFASDAEIEHLIEYSGGHPRELLRLLQISCTVAKGGIIDVPAVEQAIAKLATDFRYLLTPKDYPLLASLDCAETNDGNDEDTRRLLRNLALLEYNSGTWRRVHPAIRELDGFKRAVRKLAVETAAASDPASC